MTSADMTSAEKPPFYLTTAIAYANGPPHLGHAYEAISSDVIARFKRLDGYQVHFLTGMDEHGQKVEKTAADKGVAPQVWCDGIADDFRQMMQALNISIDDFIRTTEPRHREASQALWTKLQAKGDIYLGAYKGWYSVRDEAYFAEDELTDGPDGSKLAPTGAPVEWVEEPSYFFRLSSYQDRLLTYYNDHPDFIQPGFRRNEIENFVKRGLEDLSISRVSFKWGIPVPDDADHIMPDDANHHHIMYVWLDALTNYITALGFPDQDNPLFKTFWPASLHVIGKDIMRFHTIYWPAFLMSAGLPLPRHVFGHGFLNVEGQKMSKSLGNVLTPQALIDEFGLEPLRYFLMREVPYGQDGSFSHESIVQRINADLANDLGNLAQRVLTQIARKCNGTLPDPGALQPEDTKLLDGLTSILPDLRRAMESYQIHRMLEILWREVGACNRYIDAMAPWALVKSDNESDQARFATVIYTACAALRMIAIYLQPVAPIAGGRLLDLLAIPENARDFAAIAEGQVKAGTTLPAPVPLFPRYNVPNA